MKHVKKILKRKRVHVKLRSISNRPRLVVTRSSKHISAQIVDDQNNVTVAQASSVAIKKNTKNKVDTAAEVGKLIAKNALEKKIKKISFDRSGYKYHGRVRALAEAARKEGLDF
jgi:large subunit ribosomal protein L18